jgi:CheY-like chemotaxis protein
MRRSKAPVEQPRPRLIVVEEGHRLQRLLSRYLEGCDIVVMPSLEKALEDLRQTPAQALVLNAPSAPQEAATPEGPLANLPIGTPVVACWLPGEEEAARRLGVVHYLLKPVTREALARAMDSLPQPVRTVLVVDDEPDMVQLLGRMLASLERGYHVLRTSSGAWALDLLRERRPDVVLLDLMMEGTDGWTILERKRADPELSQIPVIAVTAVDPGHGSLAGHALTFARSGGLTFRDLLAAIRFWSALTSAQGE